MEDREADAGDGVVYEGAPRESVVDQGEVEQRPGGERVGGRVVHHLGPEELHSADVPVREDVVQDGAVPPRGVAAADHGKRPQSKIAPINSCVDHLLGNLRRTGHQNAGRVGRRRGQRPGDHQGRRALRVGRRGQGSQALGVRRRPLLLHRDRPLRNHPKGTTFSLLYHLQIAISPDQRSIVSVGAEGTTHHLSPF